MNSDRQLEDALPHCLGSVDLGRFGTQISGKVREMVALGDRRVLVTTDRVSAFDRVLGTIPYKGQVLNQLSAWWFGQVEDLVGHHLLEVPDPNVVLTREALPLPIEVVVRGHITGSTDTSLWTRYAAGEDPYGLDLPAGLVQHQALPTPVITPTTKAQDGGHDVPITSAEVVAQGLVDAELWEEVQRVALDLFARGQAVAEKAGLVLADTKYELGVVDGRLCLIDEVHTPDSSRYWERDAWEQAMATGGTPPSVSKERLRLWLAAQGYRGEGTPPALTDDIRIAIAGVYIGLFERLTGETFEPAALPAGPRILAALAERLETSA